MKINIEVELSEEAKIKAIKDIVNYTVGTVLSIDGIDVERIYKLESSGIIVSTLDCPGLTGTRGDGNTTRQINFAIQELFAGNTVLVEDHYANETKRFNSSMPRRINRQLLDRIFKTFNFFNYHFVYKIVMVTTRDGNDLSIKLQKNK